MRKAPWRFVGNRDDQGRPLEYFAGIPARDLTADDVAVLTDDQYATVEASALYEAAQAPKPSAKPVAEVTDGN